MMRLHFSDPNYEWMIQQKARKEWESGRMIDWSYFHNLNRRTFVQRPSKVGMFDSDLVQLFDLQIKSNKILFEQNLKTN